jgi:hypothetical protein
MGCSESDPEKTGQPHACSTRRRSHYRFTVIRELHCVGVWRQFALASRDATGTDCAHAVVLPWASYTSKKGAR